MIYLYKKPGILELIKNMLFNLYKLKNDSEHISDIKNSNVNLLWYTNKLSGNIYIVKHNSKYVEFIVPTIVHEYLHNWLRENIDDYTCNTLDNIDSGNAKHLVPGMPLTSYGRNKIILLESDVKNKKILSKIENKYRFKWISNY